jgi:hypothetical protein
MNDVHPLRVEATGRAAVEGIHPEFIKEKLLWARSKSWDLLAKIKSELVEGISEKEAFKLAMRVCEDNGISKHWHKPFLRFGRGTMLTFREPLLEDCRLQKDHMFYIDIGPVWADEETGLEYEGDVGDSFVFGENARAQACIDACRKIFTLADFEWSKKNLSGLDLYGLIKSETAKLGYSLVEKVDGHRIGDFPHQKYSRERLAKLAFSPAPLLWVLEVQICDEDAQCGAFLEDLLGASDKRFAR